MSDLNKKLDISYIVVTHDVVVDTLDRKLFRGRHVACLNRYFLFADTAVRYVSVGRSSHLVSFMSALAVFGLSLSVAILVLVLSVMNGFDREMRNTILGIVPTLHR